MLKTCRIANIINSQRIKKSKKKKKKYKTNKEINLIAHTLFLFKTILLIKKTFFIKQFALLSASLPKYVLFSSN